MLCPQRTDDHAVAVLVPAGSEVTSRTAAAVLGDYDASTDADTDVKRALTAAAKDGKPVLVDFGADWCPDCVVLGKLAAKPSVASLLAKFHVVSVDVGQFDHNLNVAKELTVDLQTSGIPALVVLDRNGKVRTVTNDGSFANARKMSAEDVAAFLKKWA
ncbi:thioredoxin family protein [Actinoplanes sp. NPDC051343]|uniref:thioredoxin family protein n=1 Tax=Actinoplanes sp. NPDC051343 TaxID=3363906 RepID=UPI00379859EB